LKVSGPVKIPGTEAISFTMAVEKSKGCKYCDASVWVSNIPKFYYNYYKKKKKSLTKIKYKKKVHTQF
jgi:hypothetical protein